MRNYHEAKAHANLKKSLAENRAISSTKKEDEVVSPVTPISKKEQEAKLFSSLKQGLAEAQANQQAKRTEKEMYITELLANPVATIEQYKAMPAVDKSLLGLDEMGITIELQKERRNQQEQMARYAPFIHSSEFSYTEYRHAEAKISAINEALSLLQKNETSISYFTEDVQEATETWKADVQLIKEETELQVEGKGAVK